jgi:DnaK suppressor protein
VEANRLMFFREILQQKIAELLGDQMKTVSVMTNENDRVVDLNDQASMEVEKNYELRIRDRERRLILKMKEAIQRIDNGTYGICEDCGEEISEKRLIARPVAIRCIACKTKQEKIEKLKGAKDRRVIQYGFPTSSQNQEDD